MKRYVILELDVNEDGQALARLNWPAALGIPANLVQVAAFDDEQQLEMAVLQIIERDAASREG